MASSEEVLVIDLDKSCENQRLLAGRPKTCGMRAGRVKDREELLVFLSGRGELLIGEQGRFQVGEGKVSYIPPQTAHDVRNTGAEPLVYVYCVAPAGDEVSQ
ncbi:MAG: cupin domain-containing protein [Planctomycetota bacterium]|jgi:oxalate decarboxylase/phosphoglucose isomerase-like protein (cupin superfamily)